MSGGRGVFSVSTSHTLALQSCRRSSRLSMVGPAGRSVFSVSASGAAPARRRVHKALCSSE